MNILRKISLIFVLLIISGAFTDVTQAVEGDLVWTNGRMNNNYAQSPGGAYSDVAADSTGVYVAGHGQFYSLGKNGPYYVVEKRSLDDGVVIWQIENDEVYSDFVSLATANDGLIVTASSPSWGYPSKIVLQKRDLSNGNLTWAKDVIMNGYTPHVAVKENFIYLSMGECVANCTSSPTMRARTEKRDVNGNLVWVNTSSTNASYIFDKGIVVNDQGVYMVSNRFLPSKRAIQKIDINNGSQALEIIEDLNGIYIQDIAIDDYAFYIILLKSYNASYLQKRDLGSGSIIWEKTENFSSGGGYKSLAVTPQGIFIAQDFIAADGRLTKHSLGDGSVAWQKTPLKAPPLPTESDAGPGFSGISVGPLGSLYLVGAYNNSGCSDECDSHAFIQKRELVTNTAPVVPISPANNQTITLGQNITYISTASDGENNMTMHKFDWQDPSGAWNYECGNCSATVSDGPAWSFAATGASSRSIIFTPTTTGMYTVRWAAQDSDGAWGLSTQYTVTVSAQASPTGSITPENCTITSGSTCSASIAWTTSNTTNPSIKNNGVMFSTLPSSSGTPTALNYGLNTLTLYDGATLLDTKYATGFAADQGSGGPSCNGSFTEEPTSGLCSSGTASSVTTTGTGWTWTCGSGVGIITCTATKSSTCNDGTCDPGESVLSCPQDCKAKFQQF